MKFHLDRFVEIVDRLGPAVLAVVPGGDKIAPIVPKIVAGIKEAEAIKGASGAEKKAHVLAIVTAGADVANATGRVKVNPTELQAIASKGIDTVIDAVHVVQGAKPTSAAFVGTAAAPAAALAAGDAGSLPGVDTAPRSSDLPGGKATHGHGSGDHVPSTPAPGADATAAAAADDGGRSVADNPDAPPSEAFDGGANRPPADNRPPSDTDQNG